jgi:hypothetical protein
MKTVWISALGLIALLKAFAQLGTARDAIAEIEGTVFLDGDRLDPEASHRALRENSVVRTEDGRVKILLAAGRSVFLGGEQFGAAQRQS